MEFSEQEQEFILKLCNKVKKVNPENQFAKSIESKIKNKEVDKKTHLLELLKACESYGIIKDINNISQDELNRAANIIKSSINIISCIKKAYNEFDLYSIPLDTYKKSVLKIFGDSATHIGVLVDLV